MDARVQDYLDDRLQSVADLEALDTLLENVRAQQKLLKKQLEDARRDHQSAHVRAQEHSAAIQQKAKAFQKEQEDIDRRLLTITQSDSSDDAARNFEASMGQLRKLDIATGYVELLSTVESLRGDCASHLGKSNDLALEPYKRLQQLVISLRPLQDAADGAAPHLLDHIKATVQTLRDSIEKEFSKNLEKTLHKMNWPKAASTVPLALQQEWNTNIGRLLDLQRQDLEAREQDKSQPQDGEPLTLLPFEVLVLSLEQRFSYHFSGNKPTNRLDKPEFFLNHMLELISKYTDFVQDTVQPILLRHFRGSEVAFTPAYIDATSALITALLPMLKQKLFSVASQVSSQPSLLSHLVQQVISFDNALSESYAYTPISASAEWHGLSFYLLDTCGFFQQWLSAERDFALARYNSIIETADAGEIDYDSLASDATKPTKAAIRVNDLLETITERYRHLSSYGQKIRFLIDIQIEIFDRFFQRLRAGLDAYRNRTSTVGRTINNVSKDELAEVRGVRGLDRLCRIFGAADYLERAMRDWSDDVFFLELWAELEYRARHPDSAGRALGSWHEIQQKTSSALNPDPNSGVPDTNSGNTPSIPLEGALFDETANKYRSIRVRSEAALGEALVSGVKQSLKPYGTITTWASLSSTSSSSAAPPSSNPNSNATLSGGGPAPPSPELSPLLNQLTESLDFLRRAVGRAALRRLARLACHAVQGFVWDHVLMAFKASFSTAGAAQLAHDVRAVCALVDRYVGFGQGRGAMRRLVEGVALLSLPVRGEIERVRAGRQSGEEKGGDREGEGEGDEEVEAWGEQEGGEGGGLVEDAERSDDGKGMSLFQVERLVFLNNEGARQALERLGLSTLTEADARALLSKRVEVGS